MLVLKIFHVHKNDDEKPLCTLHAGEHVIGRGSFSECTDTNISRHIVISVKDNNASLKLIHVTPIFYMSSSTPHIRILKKDESIQLIDGDKFAFIMDSWYIVKIENGRNELAGCIASTVSDNVILDSNIHETCNPKLFQSNSKKRSSNDVGSDERKKLKLMDNNFVGSNSKIDEAVTTDSQNNNDPNSIDESKAKETTEVFKKEVVSDSDDDSDPELLPEVTRDTEIVSGVERNSDVNSETCENNADKNSSDILDNIKKEPMIEDDEQPVIKTETLDIKEESIDDVNNGQKSLQHNDTDDNPGCDRNDIDASSSAAVNTTGREPVQNNTGTETVQNPPETSTDSSGACVDNSVKRERCWFGENCYRKNPNHRSQFSHPGDSDYSQDPDDGRTLCPYGAMCYRNNPKHRQEYKHPTPRPAPKPSTSTRRTRLLNLDRVNLNESDSQDDSDPFGTDESSSASENFEDDDFDSDMLEEPDLSEEDDEVKIERRKNF